ncbi:MAG: hypothetical protein NT067_04190 [Candidatus Diapherotrites archaeon]|nr:hypothetical protein [Candidatus Diapherotrites archaeon]
MRFTKWHILEFGLLALFAVSLLLLYWIMTDANSPRYSVENEFRPSMLAGALQLALSSPGKLIKTKDFNFLGPGSITSATVFRGQGFSISQGQFCLALGEAKAQAGIWGGAENASESIISYSTGVFGPYQFSVLCYPAGSLMEKAKEYSSASFKASYFSKCTCLKEPSKTCCVAAIGKTKG